MIEKIEGDKLELKIIDFGFSRYLPEDQLFSKQLGSENYMAPEIVKNETYNDKVDIWSATIVIYALLCEELPFFGKDSVEIFDQIQNNELDFSGERWSNISFTCK